jgi:hypothetical protein
MKKKVSGRHREDERDTMRPEYDFSAAVRGVTAARYAQGANIVVVDPEVLDVFPDGATVNEALRALAPVLRHRRTAQRGGEGANKPLRPTSQRARRG